MSLQLNSDNIHCCVTSTELVLSHPISQELSSFHVELTLDVEDVFVVDHTPTAEIEWQHDHHQESVVGHDRHCPQDDERTKDYRVTVVLEELLLFSRLVVHRITKAVVSIVELQA